MIFIVASNSGIIFRIRLDDNPNFQFIIDLYDFLSFWNGFMVFKSNQTLLPVFNCLNRYTFYLEIDILLQISSIFYQTVPSFTNSSVSKLFRNIFDETKPSFSITYGLHLMLLNKIDVVD